MLQPLILELGVHHDKGYGPLCSFELRCPTWAAGSCATFPDDRHAHLFAVGQHELGGRACLFLRALGRYPYRTPRMQFSDLYVTEVGDLGCPEVHHERSKSRSTVWIQGIGGSRSRRQVVGITNRRFGSIECVAVVRRQRDILLDAGRQIRLSSAFIICDDHCVWSNSRLQ